MLALKNASHDESPATAPEMPRLSVAPRAPRAGDFNTRGDHLYVRQVEAAPVNRAHLIHAGAPPSSLAQVDEPVIVRSEQDLVVQLCQMPIDLAAPLLRASLPALDTPALLALIAATGEAHHRLVAQRSGLSWRVVKALIRSNTDDVMVALASNHTVVFDAEDQAALARLAEARPALRAAIRANPGLSAAHGCVSKSHDEGLSHNNLKLVQLLRAGQATKFVLEAARRLEVEATGLQRSLTCPSAAPLALLACAMGLDRAVFLGLLPHWQAATHGEPQCNAAHRPLILSIFDMTAVEARRRLLATLSH